MKFFTSSLVDKMVFSIIHEVLAGHKLRFKRKDEEQQEQEPGEEEEKE